MSQETSKELARKIAILEAQAHPLFASIALLQRQRMNALSREFISANRITLGDVEMSRDRFRTVRGFGVWLSENSQKRWAEWGGKIYHTADIINLPQLPDMPGRVEHLPQK